jgi:hypothetical protein
LLKVADNAGFFLWLHLAAEFLQNSFLVLFVEFALFTSPRDPDLPFADTHEFIFERSLRLAAAFDLSKVSMPPGLPDYKRRTALSGNRESSREPYL